MGIRFNPYSSRAILFTKTKVGSPEKQIPFSKIDQSVPPERPLDEPSQDDLRNLRDAILKVAKDYAAQNPNATEEEVQLEVDSKFGEGVSNLVQLRLEDEGAGKTSIKVTQVDYNTLSQENKNLLQKASEYTQENYRVSKSLSNDKKGLALSTLSLKGPFLDDGAVSFQSGRYGLSFGKDEVAATAAKTYRDED